MFLITFYLYYELYDAKKYDIIKNYMNIQRDDDSTKLKGAVTKS